MWTKHGFNKPKRAWSGPEPEAFWLLVRENEETSEWHYMRESDDQTFEAIGGYRPEDDVEALWAMHEDLREADEEYNRPRDAVCPDCGWTMPCLTKGDADDMLELHRVAKMNAMLTENEEKA